MIWQSAKMAFKSVMGSKVRSFLTMLGIIIGVFALVVLVSLVDGATGYVTDTISSLGSSYITVSVLDDKGRPLHLEDLDIRKSTASMSPTAPFFGRQMWIITIMSVSSTRPWRTS